MVLPMNRLFANDHPERPASCKCLSGWTGLLQIIIQRDQHLPNDHPDQPDSSKKHHPLPQNISSWSSNLKDQGSISIKKTRTLCSRKNTKCSCSLIPQGSISRAVLGYAGYYTSMAMFAWMTVRQDDLNLFTYYLYQVICFDLFWTLCRSSLFNAGSNSDMRRFKQI